MILDLDPIKNTLFQGVNYSTQTELTKLPLFPFHPRRYNVASCVAFFILKRNVYLTINILHFRIDIFLVFWYILAYLNDHYFPINNNSLVVPYLFLPRNAYLALNIYHHRSIRTESHMAWIVEWNVSLQFQLSSIAFSFFLINSILFYILPKTLHKTFQHTTLSITLRNYNK